MTLGNTSSRSRERTAKVGLAVGFVALAVGLVLARSHPITGYELSIYGGTPLGFWVGTSVAVAVALVVSTTLRSRILRAVGLVLGGSAIVAIAALPVVRGYYFHGTADALSHLGWARDMAAGVLSPTDLFYPGIHSFAAALSPLAGIGLPRALMLVAIVPAVVTLVFVPALVRSVSRNDLAIVVGAFAAFLLFMVHNLGIYLHPLSFAQATFFSTLVLFLAIAYLTRATARPIGILLAVVSVAVILYHPQTAANLIVAFGGISLVQAAVRRYAPSHPVADHRPLYAHTGFLVVAFVIWISRFEGWAFGNMARIVDAIGGYFTGRPPVAGGQAISQASSLEAIGSGLFEIFLKLFLVGTTFTAIGSVLVIAVILGKADDSRPTANAVAIYLGFTWLLMIPVVVGYFAGNIAEHYFRHIGFMLLLATIVGALALLRGFEWVRERTTRRTAAIGFVILFAVMLPLSLATVFPSPFIHKHSYHVTEERMDGYRTAFELNDPALTLAGIRDGPWRYSEAIHGVANAVNYDRAVMTENLTRLHSFYLERGGGYLAVSEFDYEREVVAYEELRYTAHAFRQLDEQIGVNRVLSNEAIDLYHVSPSNT